MTVKFLVSMAACFACLGILWLIARIMQTPVKFGRSSTGYMLINISGAEPRLEQTLNGLLWLNDNGILRCRIIIIGTELDEESPAQWPRIIAALLSWKMGSCPNG